MIGRSPESPPGMVADKCIILTLFGSGKGDWGTWFELSESAPGFPQFSVFVMILYCAFAEKTPALEVHFGDFFFIKASAFVAKEEPQLAQPAATRDVANDNEQFCAVIGWYSTSGILEMQKELKTFVFASLAHHNLYNGGAETFNFYSRRLFYIGAGSHISATLFHISCRVVI